MPETPPSKTVFKTIKILEYLSLERSFGITEIARYVSISTKGLRTITRRSDLDRELSSIRAQGYAPDDEEHEIGVSDVWLRP